MNNRTGNRCIFLRIGLVAIFFGLLFFSCGKEGKTPVFDTDEQKAYQSEETVENVYGILGNISNAAWNAAENSGGRIAEHPELACATVDINTSASTVTIDFGSGCTGPDGRIRKGKIIFTYTGTRLTVNATSTTTLQDFYIDGIKIEGTMNVKNVSPDALAVVFEVKITGGKVIWPDASFATRISDRTQTWTYNAANGSFQLEVDGTASGITRNGISYSTNITESLLYTSDCFSSYTYLPISGKKTINITETDQVHIDYGNQTCDNTFTVAIGDKEGIVDLN